MNIRLSSLPDYYIYLLLWCMYILYLCIYLILIFLWEITFPCVCVCVCVQVCPGGSRWACHMHVSVSLVDKISKVLYVHFILLFLCVWRIKITLFLHARIRCSKITFYVCKSVFV